MGSSVRVTRSPKPFSEEAFRVFEAVLAGDPVEGPVEWKHVLRYSRSWLAEKRSTLSALLRAFFANPHLPPCLPELAVDALLLRGAFFGYSLRGELLEFVLASDRVSFEKKFFVLCRCLGLCAAPNYGSPAGREMLLREFEGVAASCGDLRIRAGFVLARHLRGQPTRVLLEEALPLVDRYPFEVFEVADTLLRDERGLAGRSLSRFRAALERSALLLGLPR